MDVPANLPSWRQAAELIGRRAECSALDQLIGSIRSGESRALVVHGEPGVGKTALLEYVAVQARGFQVLRGGGVESEMELPFAGLHQLCRPLLDRLERLPGARSDALRTAFGVSAGPTPDRFLVGLAVLDLLSEAAEDRPLICLVDDYQWLDRTSAQVLAFLVRRLGTESLGLILAGRVVDSDLVGLPELVVEGLRPADAGTLLDTVLNGPVDERVRDQIIAETQGNPLALLELPGGRTAVDVAGGFGLPGEGPLPGNIEDEFSRRAAALPQPARQLLLIAASDPSGDVELVRRAAAALGIKPEAATLAVRTGLLTLGSRAVFRHPLARSAVYRSASAAQRRQAHRALAEATDAQLDPDRQAWHRAEAATGPDDQVAAALEHSAARAKARGGLAAAAAFLLRAATLTLDPAHRAARALAAAETHLQAGALDPVPGLLAMAETGPLDNRQLARADLIRARLAFVTSRGSDGPRLLLKAARRFTSVDTCLSRATYLEALAAGTFVGRFADSTLGLPEIARAAGQAPPPAEVRAPDLLLDGTVAAFNHGYAAGLPLLRTALNEYGTAMSPEQELRWLWFASTTAIRTWDDERWDALSTRYVELARELGSLSELPLALDVRALLLLFFGELSEAARLSGEARVIGEATGTALAPYGAMGVAAFRGDVAAGTELHGTTLLEVTRRGEGAATTFAEWSNALLHNGLGRYDDALASALRATGYDAGPAAMLWPYVELIEAAARTGETAVATAAYRRFAATTSASGTDWALGLEFRSKALLSDGAEAEGLYRESIAHLGRSRMRAELARSHLLYGEWLRRERRQRQACDQLRTAYSMLEAIGMSGFAERARRELRAAGGVVRARPEARKDDKLTPQEAEIARLAAAGLSNREIARQLFISAYTVQHHLRKVFAKLDVTSRSQLGPRLATH
ncbi:MAG TPA: AAA family ATPase [Pseudonocardiaceae bacterium]|nr:AAA family ATPase [Pseudonocardiaceae bacterium]